MERTSLSASEIYRRIRQGEFPASMPLGKWKVVWLESEVAAWMAARIAEGQASAGRTERAERSQQAIMARRSA